MLQPFLEQAPSTPAGVPKRRCGRMRVCVVGTLVTALATAKDLQAISKAAMVRVEWGSVREMAWDANRP